MLLTARIDPALGVRWLVLAAAKTSGSCFHNEHILGVQVQP